MSEQPIIRNEWDGVLELVFNRPGKLNAINFEMMEILTQAVTDLRDDDRHRVMLIRANGRYFSAGADVSAAQAFDIGNSPARLRNFARRHLHTGMSSLWDEMERLEKPIIVAHHATCVGGGLEMSLSCDFRLAAQSAAYSFPELEFAILPLSGGISRLTRIVGPHWARWLVLANEKVTADQALSMGLVHRVIPDETFEEEAKAFARKLAGHPAEAMAIGKTTIELSALLGTADARAVERLTYGTLQFSSDYIEMQALRRAQHSK